MPITVARIFRYPVKSMLGEELTQARIDGRGVVGDRAYAVVDPVENRVGSAKIAHKWKRLYEFQAQYPASPDGGLPPAVVLFPDGVWASVTEPAVEERLSRELGRPVRLVSEKPTDLKLEAVKPGLDPIELKETVDFPVVNPFFDLAALHLLTTCSLAYLRSLYPRGDFDPRRFRPNLVLDAAGEEGFLEQKWVGETVSIGPEVRLRILGPTHRCAATVLPHHGLPYDPDILRTANRHNRGNVGVYASVMQGGVVRLGDEVRIA